MSYETTDPSTRDYQTTQHHDYLQSRTDGLHGEELVDEVFDQHSRHIDPENCTDEDRERRFGKNWREIIAFVGEAAELTPERAEQITAVWFSEQTLDDLTEDAEVAAANNCLAVLADVIEAGDEAMEPTYQSHEIYWETRYAYLGALMAVVAGDGIPEQLRNRLRHAWDTHPVPCALCYSRRN